jgi:hypothetical protein
MAKLYFVVGGLVCSGASQVLGEQMIEVWIIEELERRRRKDRRDEARVWIPESDEEPLPDRPNDTEGDPPRVIVIDL